MQIIPIMLVVTERNGSDETWFVRAKSREGLEDKLPNNAGIIKLAFQFSGELDNQGKVKMEIPEDQFIGKTK